MRASRASVGSRSWLPSSSMKTIQPSFQSRLLQSVPVLLAHSDTGRLRVMASLRAR